MQNDMKVRSSYNMVDTQNKVAAGCIISYVIYVWTGDVNRPHPVGSASLLQSTSSCDKIPLSQLSIQNKVMSMTTVIYWSYQWLIHLILCVFMWLEVNKRGESYIIANCYIELHQLIWPGIIYLGYRSVLHVGLMVRYL